MSGPRKIVLGGIEYAIGPFTIGQVSKIVPLLPVEAGYKSTQDASASNTAIHTAMFGTSYQGSYEDFLKLPNVTFDELLKARLEVGRAVGLYLEAVPETEKAEQPGEVAGGAPGAASP